MNQRTNERTVDESVPVEHAEQMRLFNAQSARISETSIHQLVGNPKPVERISPTTTHQISGKNNFSVSWIHREEVQLNKRRSLSVDGSKNEQTRSG
ncbi:hypothetical protein CEXT_56121 [Caerostris extrusa]|uniref:Uncharacterized protein n=1 Tax=Caerostris extrusa TaxID=172846 RepID=A0AAV4X0T5_CAEEX|nr:hypothetical protein CEXT_56121 [Caerostris extrusa]